MADPQRWMIVVSKKYNSPQIHYKLYHGGLSLEMDLDQFLDSLVEASPLPWKMLTRKRMKAAIIAASAEVIQEVKNASIHSPPSNTPE